MIISLKGLAIKPLASWSSLLLLILSINYAAAQTPQTQQSQWRTISPENTLYMDTQTGRVIFELNEKFSPQHVKKIKQLVRSGFYDGLTFYRVIDEFVIQGGDPDEQSANPLAKKTVKAEFEQTIDAATPFTLVQSPDLLAEQTGFVDGFAVGRDLKNNKQWLLHCPGTVNLARAVPADSGTTDFAIMIGQAPRHLDRNMSIFGRIIDGMEHLNLIKRGKRDEGGMISASAQRSKIVKMTIAADLPKAKQAVISVENTNSDVFRRYLANTRQRRNPFYLNKGNGALDICYINVKTQVKHP